MEKNDLLSLLDGVLTRLKQSDVTAVELKRGDLSLRVERAGMSMSAPTVAPVVSVATPAVSPAAPADNTPAGAVIKSPIVGTFYASPSPEAPAFVKAGQTVKKGDTLCIIEAMKMMNEIEAERDGVVARVLAQNGQLVEYGQPLFEMEE